MGGFGNSGVTSSRVMKGRSPARLATVEADRERLRFVVDKPKAALSGISTQDVALTLAKAAGHKPRDLAGLICEALPASPLVERTEIAGPGFINVRLDDGLWRRCLGTDRPPPAWGRLVSNLSPSLCVLLREA